LQSRRSKGTTIVHDDRTIKTLEKEIARVKVGQIAKNCFFYKRPTIAECVLVWVSALAGACRGVHALCTRGLMVAYGTQAELAALDKKPDRKITAQDLTQALIRLGKTPVEVRLSLPWGCLGLVVN
jgi:hypothetical protein